METLFLDHNNIEERGVRSIANCLHLIKNLSLKGCGLTEGNVEELRDRNQRNYQVGVKAATGIFCWHVWR